MPGFSVGGDAIESDDDEFGGTIGSAVGGSLLEDAFDVMELGSGSAGRSSWAAVDSADEDENATASSAASARGATGGDGGDNGQRGDNDGSDGVNDGSEEEDVDVDQAERRDNEIRMEILRCRDEMIAADSGFEKRKIIDLNSEAVAHVKDGDDVAGIAAYSKLFIKVKKQRLVHSQLYVAHLNRAGCYLRLRLFSEALYDSFKAMMMTREALAVGGGADPAGAFRVLVKAIAKRGEALIGLGRYREAIPIFQEGLRHDPFAEEMKEGLEAATQGVLDLIVSGDGLISQLSLPPPEPVKAIEYHQRSAHLNKCVRGGPTRAHPPLRFNYLSPSVAVAIGA